MEVLDYHKLKIFKTVADTGSFSKAADMLFLSQPTVTLQIKKIENYLGVTLFKREKKKVFLTEEGKILYKHASKIIEDYQYMEEELINFKESIRKNLILGASSTVGEYFLPQIVSKFINTHRDLKINIFIGNSKEVEEGVLSRNFHVGFIEDELESNKLNKVNIFTDSIILIGSDKKDIPDVVSVKDLNKFQFIIREKGSGTRNVVEKTLKEYGVKLNYVLEVGSSKSIARMVEDTDYLAFVSKLVVREELKSKRIKEIHVNDVEIKRNFSYITPKNIRLTEVERKFLQYVLDNSTL
ncbi:LysR substrate-binding domain-containing protein [Persephonella sp.]